MIRFTCACGKRYSVPDRHAGRSARCKGCDATLVVPKVDPRPPVIRCDPPRGPGLGAQLPMRTRRLISDARQMQAAFHGNGPIRLLTAEGKPPELYRIEYHVESLEKKEDDQPRPRALHQVEIHLTLEYPRQAPHCRMLTPIFHPNIDASTICAGDHWSAGERLVDLVVRIAEMIGYQAYNIRSPLNAEAAMWADLNQARLPLDPRNLRPMEEMENSGEIGGRDVRK